MMSFKSKSRSSANVPRSSPFGANVMSDAWTDVGDGDSMVGSMSNLAVDSYEWGHTAQKFADFGYRPYENMASVIGSSAAGGMLLLVGARKCGDDKQEWRDAQRMGIPWQPLSWKGLTKLQKSSTAR